MQAKLISQTGLKVRTNCRVGYKIFLGGRKYPISSEDIANNNCIGERDKRSWVCGWAGWPQKNKDWPYCDGNNNGKELDRCMATVWGPEMLESYRSVGGPPYNSPLGDECFNQFYGRHQEGLAIDQNKAEWENCVAGVP